MSDTKALGELAAAKLEARGESVGAFFDRLAAPDGSRIAMALEFAVRYGGIDGAHHKQWVIDQMVRALTGCPMVTRAATDVSGTPYTYEAQGESPEYAALVRDACDGDDGPKTYSWDVGIAP